MKDTNYMFLIDEICQLYHPSLRFPISLDSLSSENDINNLFQIASNLDHELSTTHLSRHDMILIISNGSTGKELINYLYKELVFSNTNEETDNEYYYIYPYRSTSEHNENNLLFMTKNLNNFERTRINDRITSLRVVTEEDVVKMISTFLVQISSTSSLSVTNAMIDTIIQNKASRIFIILNSSTQNNNKQMLYYEDIIKSIIENGYIRKLHLFVNFEYGKVINGCENRDTDKVLEYYNERLSSLFQTMNSLDVVKDLKYSLLHIPREVRLIEHLLGVKENKLESFSNYLLNLNGSVKDTLGGSQMTNGTSDYGKMDNIYTILDTINFSKLNYSVNRLQSDIQSLIVTNNQRLSKNRNMERKNNLAIFQSYFKKFQNWAITLVVFFTLFLHIVTSSLFGSLLAVLKVSDSELETLKVWSSKLTVKEWVIFYVTIVVYYLVFDYATNKFLLVQEFDKNKYLEQKSSLKHLNELKLKLNEIKKKLN